MLVGMLAAPPLATAFSQSRAVARLARRRDGVWRWRAGERGSVCNHDGMLNARFGATDLRANDHYGSTAGIRDTRKRPIVDAKTRHSLSDQISINIDYVSGHLLEFDGGIPAAGLVHPLPS